MDYTAPTSVKIALGFLAAVIVLAGYMIDDVNSGFLLGGGIPIIILAAWTRRDLRGSPAFWLLSLVWIAVDVLIILIIRPTLYMRPAILFTPLFIVDYIFVLGSFFLLEKFVKK
jgi:hypothetical protein